MTFLEDKVRHFGPGDLGGIFQPLWFYDLMHSPVFKIALILLHETLKGVVSVAVEYLISVHANSS